MFTSPFTMRLLLMRAVATFFSASMLISGSCAPQDASFSIATVDTSSAALFQIQRALPCIAHFSAGVVHSTYRIDGIPRTQRRMVVSLQWWDRNTQAGQIRLEPRIDLDGKRHFSYFFQKGNALSSHTVTPLQDEEPPGSATAIGGHSWTPPIWFNEDDNRCLPTLVSYAIAVVKDAAGIGQTDTVSTATDVDEWIVTTEGEDQLVASPATPDIITHFEPLADAEAQNAHRFSDLTEQALDGQSGAVTYDPEGGVQLIPSDQVGALAHQLASGQGPTDLPVACVGLEAGTHELSAEAYLTCIAALFDALQAFNE